MTFPPFLSALVLAAHFYPLHGSDASFWLDIWRLWPASDSAFSGLTRCRKRVEGVVNAGRSCIVVSCSLTRDCTFVVPRYVSVSIGKNAPRNRPSKSPLRRPPATAKPSFGCTPDRPFGRPIPACDFAGPHRKPMAERGLSGKYLGTDNARLTDLRSWGPKVPGGPKVDLGKL